MKNIYLVPTDKSSRLLFNSLHNSFCIQKEFDGMYINDGKVSGADFWGIEKARNNGFKSQHIYITSDEEIKEVDWMIRSDEQPTLVTPNFFWDFGVKYHKIILTTDPILIEDGVQAIDDTFLEWFVKNSSCEFIHVYNDRVVGYEYDNYTIILPQEDTDEALLPKFSTTDELIQEEPKQEPVKDLTYWKNNCEEDYLHTPISVLKYISKLEEQLNIK